MAKAVRVKTSSGWQDMALQGPQGPQGSPSGQMVLIEEKILTADTNILDFQNIPQNFASLKLIIYARSSIAAAFDTTYLRFNGDASSIYDSVRLAATGAGFQAGGNANLGGCGIGHTQGASGPADTWSIFEITIPNYANTSGFKNALTHSTMKQGATTADFFMQTWAGWWRSKAAINRVNLFMTGNFVAGTRAQLYGIKAEPEGIRQNWSDVYCQMVQGTQPTQSCAFNAWTLFPIPAPPTITITKADGVTDDFTRNADGSITINRPGNYHISASIGANEALSDGSNVNLKICKKVGATPTNTDFLGGYFNTNIGGTTNAYPGGTMAVDQYCAAGDRIALFVYQYAGGGAARSFRLDSFGIHRTGAGPQGPQGIPGVGVPTPVVNGQFIKGSGGAAVWAPIGEADMVPQADDKKAVRAYGSQNNEVGFVAPNAIEVFTWAQGDMRMSITPTRNLWWEVKYEWMCYVLDAAWVQCDGRVTLDVGATTSDANGVSYGVSRQALHSALGYCQTFCTVLFALNAGQSYTVRLVLFPLSGTWRFHTGGSGAGERLRAQGTVVGYR